MLATKRLSSRFARYIVSGGASFAVDYFMLIFLYEVLNISLAMAVSSAFVLALIVNFMMNKLWAFGSRTGNNKKHAKEFAAYLLLVGFNLTFTNLVILKLSEGGIGPAISKVLTVGCIVIWNYYVYKNYIFKSIQKID